MIVTWGGVVSSVTSTLAVLTAPGVFALAVITFGPSASGSAMVKVPFATAAGIELIVTSASAASTVPVTVVGLMFR